MCSGHFLVLYNVIIIMLLYYRIVKQNVVSTTFMRKFFCLFSHVVPGLLLIALGYTGCAPILSVALITFSMGSNGAATLTNLVNHQDLAPNFAGTLYGIANGIGNTAGFVTPLVTAYFTKNGVRLLNFLTNWFVISKIYSYIIKLEIQNARSAIVS